MTDEPAASTPDGDSRRRPWRAVLLTLLTPGIGHLYAGRPARGVLVWLLTSCAVVVGIAVSMMLPGRLQPIALAALIIALPVLAAGDAARAARRAPAPYQLRAYNRWYVYAGISLLLAYAWQPVFMKQITTHIAKAYRIPSSAMEPTLLTGDMILSVPLRGDIERADVVVYRSDMGTFVKRVVGLPGDTIAMQDGQLLIDGKPFPEPYARRTPEDPSWPEFEWQRSHLVAGGDSASYAPSLHSWGPLLISADQYFLLGDNRNNSLDSRFLGFVHRDAIFARPTIVYFSRDPTTREIRWTRIGEAADRRWRRE